MKRLIVLVMLLVIGTMGIVWAKEPVGKDKADKEQVVLGNNEFALDLYAKLREQEGNLFFSPWSISTALAMTYAGARGNTETQMAKVLHFNLPQEQLHPAFASVIGNLNAGNKERGYQLHIANALWGQQDYNFLKSFLDLTKNNYGAGLREVDFETATETVRKTINDWVEKQTRDKIKNLLKPGVLVPLTRLVLTNAIYFKGDWASQFNKKLTKNAPFALLTGKKINIPMMTQQKRQFKYMGGDGFQVLELPYVGDELSMVILLPEKTDGLMDLEKSLIMENLTQWLQKLQEEEVIVFLPKFKMTCEFKLKNVLSSMGMPDAFINLKANFLGMTDQEMLFIDKVIHKAFVDVNEEGTEASAATAVVMNGRSAAQTLIFRADHPFIFLIRDMRSGSILFLGRVMNPKG